MRTYKTNIRITAPVVSDPIFWPADSEFNPQVKISPPIVDLI